MITVVVLLTIGNVVHAFSGREIMERNDALPEADTSKSLLKMFIHKRGRIIEKEFEIKAQNDENGEDKTLISFIRPTQIKLLTHSHKHRDDDQWLRLTSGKIKRIASADRGKSFVNSHFYYEDLTSRDIDEYEYRYIGDETVTGEKCYLVEAHKRSGRRVYDKSILYVRHSDFYIVRIDLFKKGKHHKTLENQDVKKINGILTPHTIVMTLVKKKEKTELQVETIEYDIPLPAGSFNKEALR
jgi:hypothetical protein